MVGEVHQGVAQRGELPVEHGHDARLGGVPHHVVQAVVAVHQGGGVLRRHPLAQPGHEVLHGGDGRGLAGAVLARPALELALHIGALAPEIAQATGAVVHRVQAGQHPVEFGVVGAALRGRHARQGLVAQDAAFHEVHHVEGAAQHLGVFAEQTHARHRHLGAGQGLHGEVLALDGVGLGQQRARGLAAQHIAAGAGVHDVGGVGLPALDAPHLQLAGEGFDAGADDIGQPAGVQVAVHGAGRHRGIRG